jgi:hypothetical protein
MTRPNLNDPQIAQWRPFVGIAAVTASLDMNVNAVVLASFAMAWIGIESGGNVCDVGSSTATGPDGCPREIELFQIFNPDDLRALGATAAELVAYCVHPGAGPHEHPDTNNNDGGFLDGSQPNPKRLAGGPAAMATAILTSAQIDRHLALGMALIKLKRAAADHYMAVADVRWPTTGKDYWRMVKLYHALPPIVKNGLGLVAHKLGRAPVAWAEFRATYEQINSRAKFDPAKAAAGLEQDIYYRALDNAEWTGGQIPDVGSVA